jgi:hypothetical protein
MLESSETPINSNFGEFENYDISFHITTIALYK